MDVTEHICDTARLSIEPEDNLNELARGTWERFNDGSVEIEVGEFLYGLTRLLKPRYALETGTYHGISAAYVGLALARNGLGRLTTLEINPGHCRTARRLAGDLGIGEYVEVVNQDAATFTPRESIDLLFLDSEPDLRFKEVDRFYPYLAPGGCVLVHDLHHHLGLSWYVNPDNGMLHWPYGDFRKHTLGDEILCHKMAIVPLFTPRGLVLFQKAHPEFIHPRYLAGTLEELEPWS